MRRITVIAHDMRSTHNVGSLFRTSEGLGIEKLYLTGYTPYPLKHNDNRLPHLAEKQDKQISKTALGAEKYLKWEYIEDIHSVIKNLHADGINIVALEQTASSIPLNEYICPERIALLLGTEVTGIPNSILDKIGTHLSIPMWGRKESFNVVQAAAMALYELRFH